MAVLDIVRLGHPALRTPALPVEEGQLGTEELEHLAANMLESMRAASGVGLAAPQVGVGLQLMVYELPVESEAVSPKTARVVVNPMVEPEPGEMVYDWEGCLSIPDLLGLVPRYPRIRVRGLDQAGEALDYQAEGLEARVVQHEFDHLNGVVFLDRMRDLRSLSYSRELERYLAKDNHGASRPAIG